jgi:hypothetical protein
MDRAKSIQYIKIGLVLGGGFLLFRWGRKQWKMRKLKKEFGNYNTIVNNSKGNVGGYTSTDTQIDGWSPRGSAEQLRDAMKGWGTDEASIWVALNGKSEEQLKQIRNYFNRHFADGQTLFEWFEGDLSGTSLSRAKGYFQK